LVRYRYLKCFFIAPQDFVDHRLDVLLPLFGVLDHQIGNVLIQINRQLKLYIRAVEFASYAFGKIIFSLHFPP
jgi:hypothetical protein